VSERLNLFLLRCKFRLLLGDLLHELFDPTRELLDVGFFVVEKLWTEIVTIISSGVS
jgi:hypothetical protein